LKFYYVWKRHERYNHIFRDPVRMTWYRQNQEESNKEI